MSGFLGPGQVNTNLSSVACQNSCARDLLGSPVVRTGALTAMALGFNPDLGTKTPQGTRGGKNEK